jgi:outer membrane protein assembly factor BamB
MQKILVLTISVVLLLSSSVGYALTERTPDWTHIHGNAYHTGYSNHELPPPLQLLWKNETHTPAYGGVVGCWVDGRPLIFTVYISRTNTRTDNVVSELVCLKPSTGEIIWKHKTKKTIVSSPTIYEFKDGTKKVLFVTTPAKNHSGGVQLHCMDTDKNHIWTTNLKGDSSANSPTVVDGHVYVATGYFHRGASYGGRIYKIDVESGITIWNNELPDAPHNTAPLVFNNKIIIPCSNLHNGSYDGRWLGAYLYGSIWIVLDEQTGKIIRKIDYGNMRMDVLPVLHEDEVILAGLTSAIYYREKEFPPGSGIIIKEQYERPTNNIIRLNANTLEMKWHKYPRIYSMRSGRGTEMYAHSPIVSGDWIIVGSDQGMIYAYNKKNPLKNWEYQLAKGSNGPQGVRTCMATSKNYIYLNTGDTPPNCQSCKARFKIIDIENGRELWKYPLSAPGHGGVTIFDEYVYTFDRNYLYCFTRGETPKLMVDPQKIDLGEIPKGNSETTQFKVWNGGAGYIVGKIKFNVPYMKISSEQFMQQSDPKTFICTIDTTELTIGQTYNIPVLVDCATTGEKQFVKIYFTVTGLPILQVTPLEIDFGVVDRGTYSESECYIDNIGEGTLRGEITSDATWCVIEYLKWEGNHKKLIITADTTMLDFNRNYKANIFFESNGGTAKVVVTIRTKQEGPKLRVYPTELIYTDVTWGDQITGTFAIDNAGILTLEGVLEPSEDWVHISTQNFTIVDEPQNVIVTIDTTELPENETTTAEILVKSNGGNRIVNISVQIKPRPPMLKVDPPTLFFNQCNPDEYYEETLTVSNIGNGILTGDIKVSSDAPWLKIGQSDFDIQSAPLKIRVRIDTAGMPKGTSYTGKIIITSNGGSDEVGVVVVLSERKRRIIELWIGSKQAKVNGEPHDLDWPPYINNGTTMVPARFIAEAFGCIVDFYPKHTAVEEIYITKGSKFITLFIGKNRAIVDNEEIRVDVAPEIKNGRTFVPIRFISEIFGADIKWDSESKKVTISYYED